MYVNGIPEKSAALLMQLGSISTDKVAECYISKANPAKETQWIGGHGKNAHPTTNGTNTAIVLIK